MKMVSIGCATDNISLSVSFDGENVYNEYEGKWSSDIYGRKAPKSVTCNKKTKYTSSSKELLKEMTSLFRSRIDSGLLIRKIGISFQNIIPQKDIPEENIQYSLFDDVEKIERQRKQKKQELSREDALQKAVLNIKGRFGKNAVLRGISFQDGATAKERNMQIGGHRA